MPYGLRFLAKNRGSREIILRRQNYYRAKKKHYLTTAAKFSTGLKISPLANIFRRAINIKIIINEPNGSQDFIKNYNMPKKKNSKIEGEVINKKVAQKESDEESIGEDSAIDPAIIEDTFTEEFSEYNDVDNF